MDGYFEPHHHQRLSWKAIDGRRVIVLCFRSTQYLSNHQILYYFYFIVFAKLMVKSIGIILITYYSFQIIIKTSNFCEQRNLMELTNISVLKSQNLMVECNITYIDFNYNKLRPFITFTKNELLNSKWNL